MAYVMNVNSLKLVIVVSFDGISKIVLAETMTLISLFKKIQLKARHWTEILEWIEHDRFENIAYLAEGGFGTVYKAIWKDGPIKKWDSANNQWKREKTHGDHENYPVALKLLHNSQNITTEFLREVRFFLILNVT